MKKILFGLLLAALLLPAAVQAQTPTPTATPSAPAVPTLPSVAGKPLLGQAGLQYRAVTAGGVTTLVPVVPVALSSTAPHVQQVAVPGYIQKLYTVTRQPVARLSKMTSAQILALYKTYAQQLRADVYELQPDGTYLQTGWRNRPPVTPRIQPIVPGGPDSSMDMDTGTVYASYQPGQTNALDLDYARLARNIMWARNYIESLTQFTGNRGFTKEYLSFPLWLDTINGPDPTLRLIGHYDSDKGEPFARIEAFVIGEDFEMQNIAWEDGSDNDGNDFYINTFRTYYPYNNDANATVVNYQVTWSSWGGLNASTDLYLGNYLMMADVGNKFYGYVVQVQLNRANSYHGGLPAMRYTYRHATALARYIYHMQGRATQATYLWNSLSDEGFWNDLYAPLFGDNTALDPGWFFSNDAYKECNDPAVGTSHTPYPWGVYPSVAGRSVEYYPYESKVCVIGRAAYIALSRLDYLVPALQAIHVLNKYGNADYAYTGPLGLSTTPRKVARSLEKNGWNGHGIKIYLKDGSYSSGVRTNAFLVLESLLGYKYGDTTSQGYADAAAVVLAGTQWGTSDAGLYRGETADNGLVLRPNQIGGQMIGWKIGAGQYQPYALPPLNFLSDIVDYFSMPPESLTLSATNAEATGTYLQALRVYMRYKYNVLWGAGVMP